MGFFPSKPKRYKKYKDYLHDNGVVLFTAWVGPEIFRLTGIAPEKVYKKKGKVRKDMTLEEALEAIRLTFSQMMTLTDISALFEQRLTAVSEDFSRAGKEKIQSGDFAADERLQVAALAAVFEQVRRDMPPRDNPLAKQPTTVAQAVQELTPFLNMLPSTWELLVQRLEVGASRETRNINQMAILNKIKTE